MRAVNLEPFYGIYVGNTPWDTTSAALRPLLSQYGEIDGEISIRRGCAFMKYKTQESFERILAAFVKDETQARTSDPGARFFFGCASHLCKIAILCPCSFDLRAVNCS